MAYLMQKPCCLLLFLAGYLFSQSLYAEDNQQLLNKSQCETLTSQLSASDLDYACQQKNQLMDLLTRNLQFKINQDAPSRQSDTAASNDDPMISFKWKF